MRIALLVLLVAGCKGKDTGAREIFATRYSCPEDQVDVKPRPDLDAAETLAPEAKATPPDEVKADPARLAKWNEDQASVRKSWAASYADYEMFEVSGCGHMAIMGCHHPSSAKGGSRTSQVSCEESRDTGRRKEKADEKAEKKRLKAEEKERRREERDR